MKKITLTYKELIVIDNILKAVPDPDKVEDIIFKAKIVKTVRDKVEFLQQELLPKLSKKHAKKGEDDKPIIVNGNQYEIATPEEYNNDIKELELSGVQIEIEPFPQDKLKLFGFTSAEIGYLLKIIEV